MLNVPLFLSTCSTFQKKGSQFMQTCCIHILSVRARSHTHTYTHIHTMTIRIHIHICTVATYIIHVHMYGVKCAFKIYPFLYSKHIHSYMT